MKNQRKQDQNESPVELQMSQQRTKIEIYAGSFGILRHLITSVSVVASIYLMVSMIKPIFERDPEVIRAAAEIVKAFTLDRLFPWGAAAATGTGWVIERKRNKRALRKKAEYQKRAEKSDAYRTSSENPL